MVIVMYLLLVMLKLISIVIILVTSSVKIDVFANIAVIVRTDI